uniref:F-box domain-containing protein n=2 Tax=Kalanchoe fedtschenkoi TaxID=63787 RepID=A0A7N0R8E7_KALFE
MKKTVEEEFWVPEDVISEVLFLLPVKTLIRFRGVCKRWRDIISSRDFVLLHYHSSFKRRKPDVLDVMMLSQSKCSGFHTHRLTVDIKTLGSKHLKMQEEQVYQPPQIRQIGPDLFHNYFNMFGDIMLGPNLGVYCIICTRTKNIALWNPATREAKILPRPLPSLRAAEYYVAGYAFGDFKFLRIISPYCPVSKIILQLYTCHTNSWRSIETDFAGPCTVMSHGRGGVELNQIVHWCVCIGSSKQPHVRPFIFTFNLRDETCGIINLPSQLVVADNPIFTREFYLLAITGDRYLTLVVPAKNNFTDIWMMMRSSSSNNWIKHSRVEMKLKMPSAIAEYWNDFCREIVLFGPSMNGGRDLPLMIKGVSHKFPSWEKGRKKGIEGFFNFIRVVHYEESLITLNSQF